MKIARLRRLVAGMLLAAAPGLARGAAPDGDHVIELPPMLVSDAHGRQWRHAEIPGFEVLSLCPDDTTRDFLEDYHRLRRLLELVLPPELQVSLSVPAVQILCGRDVRQEDAVTDMFRHGPGTALLQRFRVLPNLQLEDEDAYTLFALLDQDDPQADGPKPPRELALTREFVAFLLQRRVPALPAWFVAGLTRLYGSLHYEDTAVELDPLGGWISPEENQTLAVNSGKKEATQLVAAGLLPMEELLIAPRIPSGPATAEAAEKYRRAWIAQAELFVRWALDGRSPEDRRAFFKFVDRASREPVTAAMFQDSFGANFEQMRSRLVPYLRRALTDAVTLRDSDADDSIPIGLRAATPAEIARLKGGWERLETGFIKDAYPALAETYREEARRTLRLSYELGDRDPRLLAEMGLCECDAGNDAAAQPLLTAAVQAGVARPRAYEELARIIYAQARARPAGPKGGLGPEQIAAVVGPLLAGRRQAPPLPAAAGIFADIWFHTEETPLPSDLVVLNEAARCFPRDLNLNYRVALLDARAGVWPAARQLVVHGLANASDEANQARFAQLQRLLP